MRVGLYGRVGAGTRVAPPVFGIGKSNPAAGAAVYAGGHESAAGVAANHGLVAGGTAFAALVDGLEDCHGRQTVSTGAGFDQCFYVMPCKNRHCSPFWAAKPQPCPRCWQ